MSFLVRLFKKKPLKEISSSDGLSSFTLSRYSEDELIQIEEEFRELVLKSNDPLSKHITRDQFCDYYFPDDPELGSLMFAVFDTKHDNAISLSEWSFSLAILSRGSKKEKVNFLFKLFDQNNDNLVGYQDIINTMRASMEALRKMADNEDFGLESAWFPATFAVEYHKHTRYQSMDLLEFQNWYSISYELHLFTLYLESIFANRLEDSSARGFDWATYDDLTDSLLVLFQTAEINEEYLREDDTLSFLLTVISEHMEEPFIEIKLELGSSDQVDVFTFDFRLLPTEKIIFLTDQLKLAFDSRRFSIIRRPR